MTDNSSDVLCSRCGVQYCQNVNSCDVEKISFNWFINNSMCQNNSAASGEFSAVSSQVNWRMHLHYRFDNIGDHHKFKLFLELRSSNTRKVFAKCKISLLGRNVDPILLFNDRHAGEYERFFPVPVLTENEFSEVEQILGKMLYAGGIVIVCQITMRASLDDMIIPTARTPQQFRDFTSFSQNEELSDVMLNVKGQQICAHKVILAAGSPLFRAMFAHEMKQKSSNFVEITDVEYFVFRDLLHFVYTGDAPVLNMINAKDMLVASDTYGIEILKSICEQFLALNLTPKTAVDILIFAEKYNAEELKKVTLRFIREHSEVLDTPLWKSLEEKEKNLVIAFLKSMLH